MVQELEDELESGLAAEWEQDSFPEGLYEAGQPSAPPRGGTLTIPPVFIITGRPFQVLNRFAFNQALLSSDHIAIINGIACHVVAVSSTSAPIRTIVLQGHTDNLGTAALNFQLGRRRAVAVQGRLTSAIRALKPGILSTLTIVPQSSGKDEPVASNSSAACRALNRRVEVFLVTDQVSPAPSDFAQCVRQCELDAEMRLGRPLTRLERLRLHGSCVRQCRGIPV